MSTMSKLGEMGERIRTQDNAVTGSPIFMVQRRRRMYGFDPDYGDESNIVWLHHDGDYEEADEAKVADLTAVYDDTLEEPAGWTRTAFQDVWDNVMPFFTRAGAEQYIAANRHNLRPEARVYVESGYRNPEWEAIRTFLASLPTGESTEPQEGA